MFKYIIKRIAQAIPLLIAITAICFALINLAPYDAVDALITPTMTREEVRAKREEYGLNDPVPVQYVRWVQNICKGELGYSLVSHTKIENDLKEKIPNTVKLVLPSYMTAFILAIIIGLFAAYHKNKKVDKLINTMASVGLSVPTFWLALLAIYLFGCKLDLLPIMGMHKIGDNSFGDFILHFIMPYCVLVIGFLPDLVRYVRSSAITQLGEDYVLVQKAFGASKRDSIQTCNVERTTSNGYKIRYVFTMLVTGAVITETVFSWPGIGVYFVKAISSLDYPIVMSILVLSGSLVILGNLLSDVLCALIDPRIRIDK